MAINKAMRAALSVLSYSEADIKKSYQMERRLKEISARRLRKPWLYHIWEHKVINGDHEVPVRNLCLQPMNNREYSYFFMAADG